MKKKIATAISVLTILTSSAAPVYAADDNRSAVISTEVAPAYVVTFAEESETGNAVISVSVPETHTLELDVPDGVTVYLDNSEGSVFEIPRLSEPTISVCPETDKEITRILLNGEDITDRSQKNRTAVNC